MLPAARCLLICLQLHAEAAAYLTAGWCHSAVWLKAGNST